MVPLGFLVHLEWGKRSPSHDRNYGVWRNFSLLRALRPHSTHLTSLHAHQGGHFFLRLSFSVGETLDTLLPSCIGESHVLHTGVMCGVVFQELDVFVELAQFVDGIVSSAFFYLSLAFF